MSILLSTYKESNIFDPIQKELDQKIYRDETPRKNVIKFVIKTFFKAMDKHIPEAENYFDLYFTGSLTTYQYSETSDMDISVFPNYYQLQHILQVNTPVDVRKQLIKIVIDEIDGRFIPGTLHPIQNFVVPPETYPQDLYKPGLRSAWDIKNDQWFVAPEKDRVHDVATELPVLYQRAADMADKMKNMLDYDPVYAKQLFKQIHKKRSLDQARGLGDFSEGNIIYKYLLHEGLFDRLRNELGIYIAKVAAPKNLANESVKVIYDFEQDRILLGTSGAITPPRSKIIGEYDGSDVHIYSTGNEFLNANYFKRLWHASFPTRPLNNIYFDDKHLPTRQAMIHEALVADLPPQTQQVPVPSIVQQQGIQPNKMPAGIRIDGPMVFDYKQTINTQSAVISLDQVNVFTGHVAVWMGVNNDLGKWIQIGISAVPGNTEGHLYFETGKDWQTETSLQDLGPVPFGQKVHVRAIKKGNSVWLEANGHDYGPVSLMGELTYHASGEDMHVKGMPNQYTCTVAKPTLSPEVAQWPRQSSIYIEPEEDSAIALDDGKEIGWLYVDTDGTIMSIEVLPEYQHQGIATAMINALKNNGVEVKHHWENMTDAGRSWAEKVGSEYEVEENGLVKYPRTYHLPWSPGATSDDKVLESTEQFNGKDVVITEKMDGENTTMYNYAIHARSLDSKYHPTRTLVNKLHGEIGYMIPDGWRVCGENMQGQHSIAYKLPSSFYIFAVFDENNICLSWEDTQSVAMMLGVPTVPVLYLGPWDEEAIRTMQFKPSMSPEIEGFVIRNREAFHFNEFSENVAKFVREDHVQTDDHWLQNPQFNEIS